MVFIYNIIIECHDMADQSVRYRACQLLAAILSTLGDEAFLDDDHFRILLALMLKRFEDISSTVRYHAALALQRLQEPTNRDDAVTKSYIYHMSYDPSYSVRRAIVMSIARNMSNMAHVIARLRDSHEAVRRAAVLYVTFLDVRQMKARHRVRILKVGLAERSTRVRCLVEEILIPGWLSAYQGNITNLLKAIRLDNAKGAKDSQYVAGKLLRCIFKRLPVSELLEWLPIDECYKLIPIEKLNKETAWYWRHLIEYLQNIDDDETLESILPELEVLSAYIRAIVVSPCPDELEDPVGFSTRQCILQELGYMLTVQDVTDPASRGALLLLINDVLTGDYGPLDPEVINCFLEALELVIPEVEARMSSICTIVSALRRPPEPDVLPNPPHIANSTARTVQAVEQTESDLKRLRKCLTILNCVLETTELITPSLHTLFTELEVELITNPEIVEPALETVTLYGLIDKRYVLRNKIFLFRNLIATSNESVVMTVLRCISDLLCVHGVRMFEEPRATTSQQTTTSADTIGEETPDAISMSTDHSTVIQILLHFLDTDNPSYRLIVVECLCRLMNLGHLESPSILSRLLLLNFDPATEDEGNLRKNIRVFFETYPIDDGVQEQIQEATLLTLRALANAPSSSPMNEVNQEAVIKFIASLTAFNHETYDSQGAMALTLVTELAQRPASAEVGLMCRLLALLEPPRDLLLLQRLARMLCNLAQELPNNKSCRNMTRYLESLDGIIRTSQEEMSNTAKPKACGTHVVTSETITEENEEVEIDEISTSNISSAISQAQTQKATGKKQNIPEPVSVPQDLDTSNVTNRRSMRSQPSTSANKTMQAQTQKATGKKQNIPEPVSVPQDLDTSNVTNRRSMRSQPSTSANKTMQAQTQKATRKKQNIPEPVSVPQDLDTSNVTNRRSMRSQPSTSANKTMQAQNQKATGKKQNIPEPVSVPQDLDTSTVTNRRSMRSQPSTSANKTMQAQNQKATRKKQNIPEPVSVPQDLDISNVTNRRSMRSQPTTSANKTMQAQNQKGTRKKQNIPEPVSVPQDLDTSNVTNRRSMRSQPTTSANKTMQAQKQKATGKKQNIPEPVSVPQDLDTSNVTNRRSMRSQPTTSANKTMQAQKQKATGKKQNIPEPVSVPQDLDTSNVTNRRSMRSQPSTSANKTMQAQKQKATGKKQNIPEPVSVPQDLDTSNVTNRRSMRSQPTTSANKTMQAQKQKATGKKQNIPEPVSVPQDLDTSNVTNRRSMRSQPTTSANKTMQAQKQKATGKKQNIPEPVSVPQDLDTSNVTNRRSMRSQPTTSANKTMQAQKQKATGKKQNIPEPVSVPQDLDTSNVTNRRSMRSQPTTSANKTMQAQKQKATGKKQNMPEPVSVPQDLDTSNVTNRRSMRSQPTTSANKTMQAQKQKATGKKQNIPEPVSVPQDLDTSNVTNRRSMRSQPTTSANKTMQGNETGRK